MKFRELKGSLGDMEVEVWSGKESLRNIFMESTSRKNARHVWEGVWESDRHDNRMDLENKHWEITDGQNNGSENSIEWEMEYKVSRSGKHCESMEKEVKKGRWEWTALENHGWLAGQDRDLWKMKADRKQSRRKWEMEWKDKSITETVETETKDHQVRNLEPGTGESRVDKGRGRR